MLTFEEGRILGSMVEKAMTTPDNYPMSLNAIVTACNQVSNREPVVTFVEPEVELILRVLADRGLAKMVHRPGDRVVKYRHALDADLGLGEKELALVAVLLLRGAQTPGELRQRTSRYVEFVSLSEVEATLEGLRARDVPLAARQDRRPGQKEHRYRHLLFGDDAPGFDEVPAAHSKAASQSNPAPPSVTADPDLRTEVAALRSEVAELRQRLDRLAGELGVD